MTWRRFSLAALLWVFGLATTGLYVSLWGRAVAADTATVQRAAALAAGSELVTDRVVQWLIDGMPDTEANVPSAEEIRQVLTRPEVEAAVAGLLTELVRAASLPEGELLVVDLGAELAPAAPVIAEELASLGYPVSVEAVEAGLHSLRPLVVRSPGQQPLVGPESPTVRNLSLATLATLGAMVGTGAAAAALAEDRRKMLRSLLSRIAVAGLSFVVWLRLGAWILDPGEGRAPARRALAELARSNLGVPVAVTVAAAVAWLGWWLLWRRGIELRRRRTEAPAEQPIPVEASPGP